MSYTVLARRYRSKAFDEVVGQEAIARTLTNAIASNRVAHAYLFCGTRGVGKTSMARIFAKALCGGSKAVDDAIMAGQDTDVIEIDAASNTGVDNVRDLIANAGYRPLRGGKKVYIIDEVHMLSKGAFNALLKTMEEPPDHIVFILCTTEVVKVPATIQSRCQRFDFRAIPTPTITQHLTRVIKDEGHSAEPELVQAVARLGNGSMRDALSLLDRLMASGEKKLTLDLLGALLGLPDRELITRLIASFAESDAAGALGGSDELLKRGVSVDQLLESLMARLRDLMVLAACGPATDLVETSEAARKEDAALASRFDAAGLVHMIALCESVHRNAKYSAAPRALLDALMVRLASAEKLADVTAVVAAAAGGPSIQVTAGNGSPARGGLTAKKR